MVATRQPSWKVWPPAVIFERIECECHRPSRRVYERLLLCLGSQQQVVRHLTRLVDFSLLVLGLLVRDHLANARLKARHHSLTLVLSRRRYRPACGRTQVASPGSAGWPRRKA